jgi:hypothetical protein
MLKDEIEKKINFNKGTKEKVIIKRIRVKSHIKIK